MGFFGPSVKEVEKKYQILVIRFGGALATLDKQSAGDQRHHLIHELMKLRKEANELANGEKRKSLSQHDDDLMLEVDKATTAAIRRLK